MEVVFRPPTSFDRDLYTTMRNAFGALSTDAAGAYRSIGPHQDAASMNRLASYLAKWDQVNQACAADRRDDSEIDIALTALKQTIGDSLYETGSLISGSGGECSPRP